MRYTVTWTEAAQQQLAAIWVVSSDRVAVTRANDVIDRELADDPQLKGVAFFGDRLFPAPPLEVLYRVIPDDRLAESLSVVEK